MRKICQVKSQKKLRTHIAKQPNLLFLHDSPHLCSANWVILLVCINLQMSQIFKDENIVWTSYNVKRFLYYLNLTVYCCQHAEFATPD